MEARKMKNGLEALKEIELKWQYGVFTFTPDFKTIETELTDYYQLQDDYESLRDSYETLSFQHDRLKYRKERQDRALEIIKNKSVEIHYLLTCKLEEYNTLVEIKNELTESEYKLLCEVLRCDS